MKAIFKENSHIAVKNYVGKWDVVKVLKGTSIEIELKAFDSVEDEYICGKIHEQECKILDIQAIELTEASTLEDTLYLLDMESSLSEFPYIIDMKDTLYGDGYYLLPGEVILPDVIRERRGVFKKFVLENLVTGLFVYKAVLDVYAGEFEVIIGNHCIARVNDIGDVICEIEKDLSI